MIALDGKAEALPERSRDLIQALDEAFPREVPVPGDAPDEIFFNAGRRHLIELLLDAVREDDERGDDGDDDVSAWGADDLCVN